MGKANSLAWPVRPGGFTTILADPPWRYGDQGSRAATPYPTMSVREIRDMPIRALAADNALLLLWTTASFREHAYPIARAWGFEPKTELVWVKGGPSLELPKLAEAFEAWRDFKGSVGGRLVIPKAAVQLARGAVSFRPTLGMGHYLRVAHEVALFCVRGKVRVADKSIPSVFCAPRRAHSEKPELVYEMLERLNPGPPGAQLELFARTKRFGWKSWGNEV